MPRGHAGLPRASKVQLSKATILNELMKVDSDEDCKKRVLSMENEFRKRIDVHIDALPTSESKLTKFNTNPYVLLFYARKSGCKKISDIEGSILPAKEFSSMETSAGRMVEAVALPVYKWDCVASEMHTGESVLDGRRSNEGSLFLATLKSGPRCLNDEMSENIADAIVSNCVKWAKDFKVKKISFTYGVLYGTKKVSNKKDWHVLRKIVERLDGREVKTLPKGKWNCSFKKKGIDVSVTVRIGRDWWEYLGGDTCFIEVMTALIRACITPSGSDATDHKYTISDLGPIVSIPSNYGDFNVALLQKEQLPWLFLAARHFCDELVD